MSILLSLLGIWLIPFIVNSIILKIARLLKYIEKQEAEDLISMSLMPPLGAVITVFFAIVIIVYIFNYFIKYMSK